MTDNMKANELMLGDWVFTRGKIEQVTSIYDGYICTEHYEDSHDYYFEPIPLTPEILEKNKFKPAKWKEDEPVGLLGKWWDNKGRILIKRFNFTLLGEVYSIRVDKSLISDIRYVHELQHCLKLVGIDKLIVL